MSDYYGVTDQHYIVPLTVVHKETYDDGVTELTTSIPDNSTRHEELHHKAYWESLFTLENENPSGCVFRSYDEAKAYCIKIVTRNLAYKQQEVEDLINKLGELNAS